MVSDSFHAVVFPAGETAAPEMVHGPAREGQEEDCPRVDRRHSDPEAQDEQLHRVEGHEDRLQKVRRTRPNQWTHISSIKIS